MSFRISNSATDSTEVHGWFSLRSKPWHISSPLQLDVGRSLAMDSVDSEFDPDFFDEFDSDVGGTDHFTTTPQPRYAQQSFRQNLHSSSSLTSTGRPSFHLPSANPSDISHASSNTPLRFDVCQSLLESGHLISAVKPLKNAANPVADPTTKQVRKGCQPPRSTMYIWIVWLYGSREPPRAVAKQAWSCDEEEALPQSKIHRLWWCRLERQLKLRKKLNKKSFF